MWISVKTLAVLVICVFSITNQQVNDPEYMTKQAQVKDDCAKAAGMDDSDIVKIWANDTMPDDPKIKCLFKCINENLGIIDATGDVIDAALENHISHFTTAAITTQIVQQCKDIKNSDLCEAAYLLTKCIMQAD